jgi:hypothetical protein
VIILTRKIPDKRSVRFSNVNVTGDPPVSTERKVANSKSESMQDINRRLDIRYRRLSLRQQ